MPVALMFDGPSLGGFVCPATITSSQIWKMGQVSANDTVHFKRMTLGKSFLHRFELWLLALRLPLRLSSQLPVQMRASESSA